MNARDERLLRSTWEPELSTTDELDRPPRTIRRARTAQPGSSLTVAVVAVSAFLAGVVLGPSLQQSGQPAPAVAHTEPASGAGSTTSITGALYDGGWAGGPGPGYQPVSVGDQRIAPWTACGACYEQGWAGGPGQGYQPPPATR